MGALTTIIGIIAFNIPFLFSSIFSKSPKDRPLCILASILDIIFSFILSPPFIRIRHSREIFLFVKQMEKIIILKLDSPLRGYLNVWGERRIYEI